MSRQENMGSADNVSMDYNNYILHEGKMFHAVYADADHTATTDVLYMFLNSVSSIHAEFELSARELDTLKLIAENLMNQEIADKLFISVNTVKTHLKNINLKLGVESRLEAVTKAKELRLI